MTTIPSPIYVVANERTVVVDLMSRYMPAEFHGTISWPEVTTPTGDPRRWLVVPVDGDDHPHIQMLSGIWGTFWESDEDEADNPL